MKLHQVARLAPVLDLVRDAPSGPVLDVGSGDATIAPYLSRDRPVTAVDYQMPEDQRHRLEAICADVVDADARQLPFHDDSFDVSVAIDLMEHIPPDGRTDVLLELARVTRRRVIVAGPAGPAARAADAAMFSVYSKRAEIPVWLREHRELGLPSLEDLTGPLAAFGQLQVIPSANARTTAWSMNALTNPIGWHTTTQLGRICAPALTGDRLAAGLLRWLRAADRPPVYRQIVVADASRQPREALAATPDADDRTSS
jgi:SAM-dependent methyltransferase